MKAPRNYDELREAGIEEMNQLMWSLEDRADVMRKFIGYMDACEEWSPETYESALAVADIEDYNDHKELESLLEIIENWPDVSWGPGKGGYW